MDVFLTSPWIPAEWIRAHGLPARGIWSGADFQHGTWPLSAGLCAFAEAAVRLAEARTDSAVIFSTACDQISKGQIKLFSTMFWSVMSGLARDNPT